MDRKFQNLTKVLFYFCLFCLTNVSNSTNLSSDSTEGVWSHYEGKSIRNAFLGGSQEKGTQTYVCRVKEADGGVRPGKHVWDCCFVSNGTNEVRIYDFDVLVNASNMTMHWVKNVGSIYPIEGGRDNYGSPLFLCRFRLPVYEICSPSNKCKHFAKRIDGSAHSRDDIVNGYYEHVTEKCVVTWGGEIYSSTNNLEIEILISSSTTSITTNKRGIQSLQSHREIPERVYFEPLVTFPKADESLKTYLDTLLEIPKVESNGPSRARSVSPTAAVKRVAKALFNIGSFLRRKKMKSDEQKKMESYIKQEINTLDVKLTLEDVIAKLCSVTERLIQTYSSGNNTFSYEDIKLEIISAVHTMDELYEKFSDENYSLWQYPLVTAPYYLIYSNVHNFLLKITPRILSNYDEFCLNKRQQVSALLFKFSSWFIQNRINVVGEKTPNYFEKEGIWTTLKSLGYCYAKGTFCGGPIFHIIDDPYDENFRPIDKNPGYYTFRNYYPAGIYKTQLQIIYSDYFNKYVDFSVTNQTKRTQKGEISDTCYFENPRYTRVECGFAGITKQQCESRNCCYDESTFNVKWCFKGNNQETDIRIDDQKERTQPKTLNTCVFDFPLNRTNCGQPGISKKECESKGCCYDPKFSQQQGQTIYFCFRP